jgi:hypothetical protein
MKLQGTPRHRLLSEPRARGGTSASPTHGAERAAALDDDQFDIPGYPVYEAVAGHDIAFTQPQPDRTLRPGHAADKEIELE